MNAQSKIDATSIVGVLAQALPELGAVHKNKNNPHFKSNYADLNAVLQALAPITDHGLWFRQEGRPSDKGVALETYYIHESGTELSAGVTEVPVNKNDAQAYGSAQSYCRRYALLTAFGLSADDDDGNAAARGQSKGGAVSPSQPINDSQWAMLVQLIEAAGVGADTVCTAANVPSLKELPATKFDAVVKKLNRTIEAKRQTENA